MHKVSITFNKNELLLFTFFSTVGLSQATTNDKERTAYLGKLTMSYTIGSVIGPALGGFLGATGDYYLGAKIAGNFKSHSSSFLWENI